MKKRALAYVLYCRCECCGAELRIEMQYQTAHDRKPAPDTRTIPGVRCDACLNATPSGR